MPEWVGVVITVTTGNVENIGLIRMIFILRSYDIYHRNKLMGIRVLQPKLRRFRVYV